MVCFLIAAIFELSSLGFRVGVEMVLVRVDSELARSSHMIPYPSMYDNELAICTRGRVLMTWSYISTVP